MENLNSQWGTFYKSQFALSAAVLPFLPANNICVYVCVCVVSKHANAKHLLVFTLKLRCRAMAANYDVKFAHRPPFADKADTLSKTLHYFSYYYQMPVYPVAIKPMCK